MRLDWLRRLTDHAGPFATLCTPLTDDDGPEPGDAGSGPGEGLRRLGVPETLVRQMADVARSRTRRGGPTHRVVVATADGVLLDQVLATSPCASPPPSRRCSWGPLPDLVPVVRSLARTTSCLLVEVEEDGTHLLAVSPRGHELEAATVLEDRELLAPVPGGGWVHDRTRVPGDPGSPAGAAVVARRVEELVDRHRPDVVLVVGTDARCAAVLGRCAVGTTVVRLAWPAHPSGPWARVRELSRVLDATSRARDARALARFHAAGAPSRSAVAGRAAVLAALRAGAVQELLLSEGREGRPDQDLVWAAVLSGAEVTLLRAGTGDPPADGVGAVLRPLPHAGTGSRVAGPADGTYT